jgi:hypothetical protein
MCREKAHTKESRSSIVDPIIRSEISDLDQTTERRLNSRYCNYSVKLKGSKSHTKPTIDMDASVACHSSRDGRYRNMDLRS